MEPSEATKEEEHSAGTKNEALEFADSATAFALIDILTSSNKNDEEGFRPTLEERDKALGQLRKIFDRYLELPSLLDRHVERMVQDLSSAALEVISHFSINEEGPSEKGSAATWYSPLPRILSSLYALSKVRGRKRIQKFLPHEVHHLQPILETMEMFLNLMQTTSTTSATPASTSVVEGGPELWESVYTLWNWTGILCIIPFDLAVVIDSTSIQKFVDYAKGHLSVAGPTREVAASSLASWLCRPDLEQTELRTFQTWAVKSLQDYASTSQNVFEVLGILQTVVTILKVSKAERKSVLEFSRPLWGVIADVSDLQPSNVLLRRYLMKWWTRIGMLYMPPRIASWRYQQARRSIQDNLDGHTPSKQDDNNEILDSDMFLVPDEVEEAMGRLLSSLTDHSTVVRWSAAKGIGRVTERLPAVCADDVLDAILRMFGDKERDNDWHGACLALAELSRRGLLLPHRLSEVVPRVVEALQFDVPRRSSSVGAHVRDAACYTSWAMARAYSAAILSTHVEGISQGVVLTFLFDREVNCRRAANAAFQELVGRLGSKNFPNGISILTRADYFSLGNRVEAYTSIACHVAQYQAFVRAMVDHVYLVKLSHWDINIRRLAARSIRELWNFDSSHIREVVFPFLLEASVDPHDMTKRHGGLLGLSQLLAVYKREVQDDSSNIELDLPVETLSSLIELVPTIEKKRLYRGKGGEQMREAVCQYVDCLSKTRTKLTVKQQVQLLDSTEASLPHPNENVSKQAATAIGSLLFFYFPVGPNGPSDRLQGRVVDKYLNILNTNDNPAATRGFASGIGYLPAKLLAPTASVLESSLVAVSRLAHPNALVGNEKDAETRRNALTCLARICTTVGVATRGGDSRHVSLSNEQFHKILDTLVSGLSDYNMDRRGDIGSMCRIAAIRGLEEVIGVSCSSSRSLELIPASRATELIGALLKQLSEKLDAVRFEAGRCLVSILRANKLVVNEETQTILSILVGNTDCALEERWSDATFTFPKLVQVMNLEAYFESIFSGLILSVGCLTQNVAAQAKMALLRWAKGAGPAKLTHLGNAILRISSVHEHEGRVLLPLLKTTSFLIDRMPLDCHIRGDDFSVDLLADLRKQERLCKDIHRLTAMIQVALGLLKTEDTTPSGALAFTCRLLKHEYPRLRSIAAEHLYVKLVEEPSVEDDSPVLAALLNNPWGDCQAEEHVEQMANDVGKWLRVANNQA